jgi:hypothetical protein
VTSAKPSVRRKIMLKNADNFAVWVSVDKSVDLGSHAEKLSLLNAEIQSICNNYISTLDDTLQRKSPRPNPTPRVFKEQGNDLSQILWLRWEP